MDDPFLQKPIAESFAWLDYWNILFDDISAYIKNWPQKVETLLQLE